MRWGGNPRGSFGNRPVPRTRYAKVVGSRVEPRQMKLSRRSRCHRDLRKERGLEDSKQPRNNSRQNREPCSRRRAVALSLSTKQGEANGEGSWIGAVEPGGAEMLVQQAGRSYKLMYNMRGPRREITCYVGTKLGVIIGRKAAEERWELRKGKEQTRLKGNYDVKGGGDRRG